MTDTMLKISMNMEMKHWVSKAYTISINHSVHDKELIDWYIKWYKKETETE